MSLIHTSSGNITISENARFRWLGFGETIQTAMSKNEPANLVLPHLHALSLLCYLRPNLKNILELGLGGGAMSRFLLHHHPKSVLTSVEFSDQIIQCFSRFFRIPNDHHNLIHDDASKFIYTDSQKYDGIIVDLFMGNKSPEFIMEKAFYQQLWQRVDSEGILALNILPHGQVHFDAILEVLRETSQAQPLCFTVPGFKNRIMFLANEPLEPVLYTPELLEFAHIHHIDLNVFMPLKLTWS